MTVQDKIKQIVRGALPKGARADFHWRKTAFGGSQVLTVVTSAWKTLPVAERVHRIYKALDKVLTDEEKDQIFRVSVLTPEEAKKLDLMAA